MSTGYTTLPPIFTTQHRPGGSLSISHTARSRAAAAHGSSHSGGGGPGGAHSARGSSDRRGLKPPLPEFRKKKDLTPAGSKGSRDDIAAARDNQNGATLIASNRKVAPSGSGGSGPDGKRGRMLGPSGGVGGANHHHLVGVSSSNGLAGGGIGRSSSDEATISSDGTVTFGPNLSLLMSSLAVRFDDAGEWDEAINGGGGGGAGGGGRSRRLGDDGDHVTSSLALLSSRKRAAAKKKEWNAMNALYSKAMEDKSTTKEQSQWFLARFNYSSNHHPIIHTPAPGTGAGLIPPAGMRQAVQQQSGYLHHANSITGAGHAPPSAEHAHLLHSSASGSYLKNHHNGAAEQATSAAVRVEEEPEEELDEQ
jgi:hypothetical protein